MSRIVSVLSCICVLASCSSAPVGDMPDGPLPYAHGHPDPALQYDLPSCSSPPDSAVACSGAAGCDDGNPCTTDACVDGECSYHVLVDGAACGQDAACDADGCCDDR